MLSDKQMGLILAIRKVLPKSHHQFCQTYYLRNLAEPLADTDAAFKVDLRKSVRQHVGDLIRKDPRLQTDSGGVLTVTGLLPSPIWMPEGL
jgi:Transposase, Mutator family